MARQPDLDAPIALDSSTRPPYRAAGYGFGGRVLFADGSEVSRAIPTAAPAYGADTDAVLAELGYDMARIAELRAAGVLGPVA